MDQQPNAPLPGHATITGTERFAERFAELHPTHFRLCQGLIFSSIGIGTYLGSPDSATDENYRNAIVTAVRSGCNVIDTAANYRFQRSERTIGQALPRLLDKCVTREELIICSKAGFITYDGDFPADPYTWIMDNLIKKGVVTENEIHPSGHCMAPMYLLHQLKQSLQNLNLSTIDVFYVHNPETQIGDLNEVRFYGALELAFRALESAVHEGKIATYGIATWDGFLENKDSPRLLQLEKVLEAARKAGGDSHHCRAIQVPVNFAMTSAITEPNQVVAGKEMTLLEAARAFNVCVVASASLLQGSLSRNLPLTLQQAIPGLPSDAQRALQFTRSTPGIVTALVGMQSAAHAESNLELAGRSAMNEDDYNILFGER